MRHPIIFKVSGQQVKADFDNVQLPDSNRWNNSVVFIFFGYPVQYRLRSKHRRFCVIASTQTRIQPINSFKVQRFFLEWFDLLNSTKRIF